MAGQPVPSPTHSCSRGDADIFLDIFLDRIAHTKYIDAVYCYRPSSVVCRSVCRSGTLVNRAKTAEPMEMPFGFRSRVGTGNHVLDGGPDPPWEWAILGEKGADCKV